jgi:molybdate transport system ATP-binding protein
MSLTADVRVDRAAFTLDVTLAVESAEVVAVLGPNGAGKSTLLAAIAGLIRPDGGHVALDGRTLVDIARGTYLPPQHRRVGLVLQDYLLFPHLTALENVAFGPRARGVGRRPARADAARWLDRMGIGSLAGRRPHQLSGGQAQRVALARALATDPRLLLLDEPLASLDAGSRPAVRADLRKHLASYDGCTLLVTHDPLEALVLGHRIVVIQDGKVVQQGSPDEVTRHPRTEYVARLVGLNLLTGHASGQVADLGDGASLVLPHAMTGRVHAVFAPAAVTLSLERPHGSARNCWPGRISDIERHGDLVRISVDGTVPILADLTPLAVSELNLTPGTTVWSAVKASEVTAYPA